MTMIVLVVIIACVYVQIHSCYDTCCRSEDIFEIQVYPCLCLTLKFSPPGLHGKCLCLLNHLDVSSFEF